MVELALLHQPFKCFDGWFDPVVGIDTGAFEEIKPLLPIECFQDSINAAAEILRVRVGFE